MVLKIVGKKEAKISVKGICQVGEVNRSSYYAWLKRPVSKREKENILLVEKIKTEHIKSKGIYGAPRISRVLAFKGQSYGQNRIAKLMQKERIFGCARKKYRAISMTDSRHHQPISPRIFKIEKEESLPHARNQVWVGDMTYIPTQEGWLYLTTVMDLCNRKIVGHCMADHLGSKPVWEAMKMGIKNEVDSLSPNSPQLVVHSDRGTQYASKYYREKLALCGMKQSMSRNGNCYDNAYAESFFHSLKVELTHRHNFATRTEARKEIEEYIVWYNHDRLHSALGYTSPVRYEGYKTAV